MLRDYILKNIDQVKIFSEYLEIPESDILDSIRFKLKLTSPFRTDDSKPSLSFKQFGNKIICNDFGNAYYRGDVFEIVGKLIGKDHTNSKEFIDICNNIINSVEKKISINKDTHIYEENPTSLSTVNRSFVNEDFRYFWKYNIGKEIVTDAYFAVKTFTINDRPSKYRYSTKDPCYGYFNNPDTIKLYFPFRDKQYTRFISNNKFPIELIHTIQFKRITCLIKAYKDKLLMDFVCKILNINDIQFLPLSSESVKLTDDIVALLRKYTSGTIVTLLDIDRCGVETSMMLREKYKFRNIFLGDNFSTKDPTDLVASIKLKAFAIRFYNIYKTL